MPLPEKVGSETELEDLLAEPTDEDVATVARLEPEILILGAGGKMGPSLARRVRRAAARAGPGRPGLWSRPDWLPQVSAIEGLRRGR